MSFCGGTSRYATTSAVLSAVKDDQLDGSTPCEKLTVRELVAHLRRLGLAFAAAARKDLGGLTDSPPWDGGYQLDDWRTPYPANLAHLAGFAADGPVDGLFGPAVEISDDASDFERALALSGRSPAHWIHGSGGRAA